ALDHANVVAVHDAGQAGDALFIASALVEGPTLERWLRGRSAPVPPAEAAALVEALARGVAHAHARGVVHRGLKPSNVLLSRSGGGRGRPFGRRPPPPRSAALSPRSPTSAWPASATTAAARAATPSSARRPTWPRSRPPAASRRSARPPTCGRWGSSSTSCSS